MADTPEPTQPDPDAPPPTPPPPTVPPPGDPDEGAKKALDAERSARKAAEKAAKAAQDELDKLRQASMSEQEKAVAVAKAEGKAEALRESGVKLVDANVRAAAAGRPVDVDALLEGLDRTRFLDEANEPDLKAIQAWVDRVAPAPTEEKPGFPDFGQGVRSGSQSLAGDPLAKSLKGALGIT